MIEGPNIDDLLSGPLGSWLEQQAHVRDAARQKSNGRFFKSALVVLPLAAFLYFGPEFSDVFKMWIISVTAMGMLFWSYLPRQKAIQDTKHGINDALAQALGLTYSTVFDTSAGFARAQAHKMVPRFDQSRFEDMWSGEVSGRPFTLHEATLKQRRQSNKRTHYVTVFQGPVMTIGFARNFQGTTLVERAGKHRKFGFFGEKDDLELDGRTLQKVDMVHPEFEDEFTIYSTDQVEARYLVHPTYVERLIALEQAFAGKKVRTLFQSGELTVVLETKNMFESGGLDARRDREMVETCIAQFMSMAQLADSLNEPAR